MASRTSFPLPRLACLAAVGLGACTGTTDTPPPSLGLVAIAPASRLDGPHVPDFARVDAVSAETDAVCARDTTPTDTGDGSGFAPTDALPSPVDAPHRSDAAEALLDAHHGAEADDLCWPIDRAAIEQCALDGLAELDVLGIAEPEQLTLTGCLSDTAAADAWYDACTETATAPVCEMGFDAWFAGPLEHCADALADDLYDRTCVFGRWWGTVEEQRALHRVSGARAIYPIDLVGTRLDQAVAALHTSGYPEVASAEDVFATVQDDGLLFEDWWDSSAARRFESVTYGLGDNTYGAVFWADSTVPAAVIGDSDVRACAAMWGPHMRRCASADDCAVDELCTGFGATGQGRCAAPRHDPEPRGAPCLHGAAGACESGLVCMGPSGSATCEPAWMHGVFADHGAVPVTASLDGGARGRISVTGLATVATSAWVDVRVDHPEPEQLTGYIESPAGSRYAIDGLLTATGGWGGQWLAVPGDEPVNGDWQLVVADTRDDASSGWLVQWSLELTSRWD